MGTDTDKQPTTSDTLSPNNSFQAHLIKARLNGPTKSKRLLLAVLSLVILIILCISLYILAFETHGPTIDGVNKAQTATNDLSTDWTASFDALGGAVSTNSQTKIRSDLNNASAQLKNAENEFNVVLKTNALKDKKVDAAFSTFSNKWRLYYTYLNNEIADLSSTLPSLSQLDNTFSAVSKDSSSQAGSALSSLKSVSTNVTNVFLIARQVNQPDKKLVSDVLSSLKTIAGDLSSASQAEASNNQTSEINDIIDADDTFNTLATTTNSDTGNISKAISRLDPSSAYNNFGLALNNLNSRLSK